MAVRTPYIPYDAEIAGLFRDLHVTINTREADGVQYWDPNEYSNWLDEAQNNSWDVEGGEALYNQLPDTFSFIYWSVEGHCWY